jgi:putative ABC transport system substrate-binding protein
MTLNITRREVATALGGAAAWPIAARGQQAAMPVIGYISGRSADSDASMLVAIRRGLSETGYIEGRNLAIEYRFADAQRDRGRAMLTELTRRQVAVILSAGFFTDDEAILKQLRASQIPIVFNVGGDPVRNGLVTSMNRPGGNLTGIYSLIEELTGKTFGLLHELVPRATAIALLHSQGGRYRQTQIDAAKAAATLGLQLRMLNAGTDSELDAAFATLDRQRIDAMMVVTTPFLLTRFRQIVALAARHSVPAIYSRREFAEAGGLTSYGYDVRDGYRQMGNYAGRILKGEKPADLPVIQPTKYELVINLKTAKALGLEVPPLLLARADDVIE